MDTAEEDPRRELRMEMQKRRPSVLRVRKLCVNGLNSKIPSDLRSEVWQVLLGVESKDRFLLDDSIRDTPQDLENQRVIRVDAQRTRADVTVFRDPDVEALVTRLLTFYCKRKSIKYKQGLNEVLAPFVMVRREPPLADGTIFNLFYAFIERFMPHMYVHEEFHALQCTFRLFRLLLLYHAPELCRQLDTHNLPPELYATPWFLTMFARNVPLEILFQLWDIYLLQEESGSGTLLNVFVALALLIENAEVLMQADQSELPIFVNGILGPPSCVSPRGEMTGKAVLSYPLTEDFDALIEKARKLRQSTPRAFAEAFAKTVLFKSCPSFAMVEQLESQPCMFFSPTQLVELLTNKDRKRDEQMFVQVLDCRPLEQFESDHLIGSLHLDPALLDMPEHLLATLGALSKRTGNGTLLMHFVLVGESTRNNDSPTSQGRSGSCASLSDSLNLSQSCVEFVFHLVQLNFGRVSCIEGGWEALRAVALEEPIFEHGMSIDQLVYDIPKDKAGDQEDGEKDTAAPSSSWVQRIGRTFGGEGTRIGGLFSASSSSTLSFGSSSPFSSMSSTSSMSSSTVQNEKDSEFGELKPSHSQTTVPTVSETGNALSQLMGKFALSSHLPGGKVTSSGGGKSLGQEDGEAAKQEQQSSLMFRMVSKVRDLTEKAQARGAAHVPEFARTLTGENSGADMNSHGLDPEAWFDVRNWEDPMLVTNSRSAVRLFDVKVVENIVGGKPVHSTCAQHKLAISPGYIIRLGLHPDRPTFARIEDKRDIKALTKITSKKSAPNVVIFHFKGSGADTDQSSYVLDNSRECIELVKRYYTKQSKSGRR